MKTAKISPVERNTHTSYGKRFLSVQRITPTDDSSQPTLEKEFISIRITHTDDSLQPTSKNNLSVFVSRTMMTVNSLLRKRIYQYSYHAH